MAASSASDSLGAAVAADTNANAIAMEKTTAYKSMVKRRIGLSPLSLQYAVSGDRGATQVRLRGQHRHRFDDLSRQHGVRQIAVLGGKSREIEVTIAGVRLAHAHCAPPPHLIRERNEDPDGNKLSLMAILERATSCSFGRRQAGRLQQDKPVRCHRIIKDRCRHSCGASDPETVTLLQ